MSESIPRQRLLKLIVLCVVVTALVVGPAGVWASHAFNDVPTNHPFHPEISAIVGAGITTGFNDGGFHPSADITRQAMAAFMERGIGRVGLNSNIDYLDLLPNTLMNLTGVFVDAGATGSGTGLVYLLGSLQIGSSAPAECPCHVQVRIVDELNAQLALASFDVPGQANEGGTSNVEGTIQAVVPLAASTRGEYTLKVQAYDSSTSLEANGTLSAMYFPLGPDGDSTLDYCSPQESEPNGSTAQAEPSTSGTPMYGCLEPADDHDFFSIAVPASHYLTATTSGLGGDGTCDMDTKVRIYDPASVLMGENDDYGSGLCSRLVVGPVPAGNYFVEVLGFSTSATGSYRLTNVTSAAPPAIKPAGDAGKE